MARADEDKAGWQKVVNERRARVRRWLEKNPDMQERARYILAYEAAQAARDCWDASDFIDCMLDGQPGYKSVSVQDVAEELADLYGAEDGDWSFAELKRNCIEPD